MPAAGTVPISVDVLQRGILGYRQSVDSSVPSPGRVDGAWGPVTHEALRGYVATVAPRFGLDAAVVLAPLRSVPARARTVELNDMIAATLTDMAASYRAPAPIVPTTPAPGTPPATRPTMTPARVGGGSGLAVGAGVVVGLLVVGGAWYFWGRK